ncbi:MAG: hypothetical protein ACI32N_05645 [Bulleidia sp.]
MEVSEEVYDRIRSTVMEHAARKEIRYAKLGVTMSLLRIPHRHTGNRYFCTEYVADVPGKSGAALIRRHITRCFSKDLKKLPGMKLHFEGHTENMIAVISCRPVLCRHEFCQSKLYGKRSF